MNCAPHHHRHVPDIAARWIVRLCLPARNNCSFLSATLSMNGGKGLGVLTVDELKTICRCIEGMVFHQSIPPVRRVRGYKSAKKMDIIQMIRRCFYTDFPTCQQFDDAVKQELQHLLRTAAAIDLVATANVSSGIAATHPPIFQHPNSFHVPMTFSTPDPSTPLPFGRNSVSYNNTTSQNGKKYPQPVYYQNTQKKSTFVNGMQSSATRTPTFIKAEGPQDYDVTPRDPDERMALGQLQQMGFSDNREMLASYRQLREKNNGKAPDVNDVMLDLIHQREESEEARKMDGARMLSEVARKNDAKRRREEIARQVKVQIENATVDEWLSDEKMFPRSWLLTGRAKSAISRMVCNQKTPMKLKFIELLDLEKDSCKFYEDLPRAYFCNKVTERLLPIKSAETMKKQLQVEVDKLRSALFQLSEQVGGVPKVFRDAHDEFLTCDKSLRREVVLVEMLPLQETNKRRTVPTATEKVCKQKTSVELIEIL